ncbi:MAG TPA: hypothetical protein VIG80_13190 [Bacillaceae bacterium]
MKPFELWKTSFRSLIAQKRFGLWILVYILAAEWFLITLARQGSWSDRGLFDLIADPLGWGGGTNHHMFILVAIPTLVLVLGRMVDFNQTAGLVLKFGSRFKTWHANVLSAIFLSALLACLILGVSLLVAGLMVGWENTWLKPSGTIGDVLADEGKLNAILPNLAGHRLILVILATKFLGFVMISSYILFLKNFIKNDGFILIILIAMAGLDYTGVLRFPVFAMSAVLTFRDWLEPATTVYHSLYLFIVSLVLYSVSGWLYERKDFLS